jgi:hypothetical protein
MRQSVCRERSEDEEEEIMAVFFVVASTQVTCGICKLIRLSLRRYKIYS